MKNEILVSLIHPSVAVAVAPNPDPTPNSLVVLVANPTSAFTKWASERSITRYKFKMANWQEVSIEFLDVEDLIQFKLFWS
jgi:hypothetical protein